MIAWLADNLIWASAAMLAVLAVRRPVARFFGAGAAYALWIVPAFRLIAPPAAWFAPFASPLPPFVIELDGASGGPPLPPDGGPGQWVPIILAVWAGGAFLFLLGQGLAYRRFLNGLSTTLECIGRFEGVPVLASAAVDGPLAFGMIRRRIVVPADFETRYSPSERALALAHEAYHHRRRDIEANHIALLVLALNWPNPIAWLAFRAFRADQELSCDAAIANVATLETRRDYAHALVKSASKPGLVAACPLNHANQLKRRLKMLNHHRKSRARTWAGAGITVTLIAASMAFGAPGHAQERGEPNEEPGSIIITEHRGGDRGRSSNEPGERGIVVRREGRGNVVGIIPRGQERIKSCREGRSAFVVRGSAGNRTRVLLCRNDDDDSAAR